MVMGEIDKDGKGKDDGGNSRSTTLHRHLHLYLYNLFSPLLTNPGVGGWATQFVLALLLVDLASTTGRAAFVPGVTRDTHFYNNLFQYSK